MKKIAALGIATLMALTAGIETQGEAAENEAIVRVALTDMSASVGMGPMGQMMMGPGYGLAPVATKSSLVVYLLDGVASRWVAAKT